MTSWTSIKAMKWDRRFLGLAKYVSGWSKDPSTKCGAVIVRGDRTVASVGYNGFPMYTSDAQELYADRAVKLERVVHAEANAIVHSGDTDMTGYSIYVTRPTCSRCAALIIQAGISEIVCALTVMRPEWTNSIAEALKMYDEAGMEVRFVGVS